MNFTDSRFLLAQLQIDSVAKKLNRRDLRNALENLPKTLNDMYDEIMERIWSQEAEEVSLAQGILTWVCYTRRNLSINELQHALLVSPGSAVIDEEAITDIDILISVCAGLVTVDEGSNIVRLAHYTTQKYLAEASNTRIPNRDITIAATCLSYLCLDFNWDDLPSLENLHHLFPLYRYAVLY